MGVPEHVTVRRVICSGSWQGISNPRCRDPRPTLVEFANPRHKDMFFASANRIQKITRGEINIERMVLLLARFRLSMPREDNQKSIPYGCKSLNCE